MKVSIVFGSHKIEGKNKEIETAIKNLDLSHVFDFIRLAEMNISPTLTPYYENDMFDNILARMVSADVVLLVIPVYCPYPAKFVAFMERLLDVSYLNPNKPLLGKKTAIVHYCSTKICDEKPLKTLFQKYLMNEYRFDIPNYEGYINNEINPNEKYDNDVTKYVLDILKNL
jgi:multimeric flavodoxin WrbA